MRKNFFIIILVVLFSFSCVTSSFASQKNYSTPDLRTYTCVKCGSYIYTTAGMEKRGKKHQARIYKIHYKTGKKKVIYTPKNTSKYDFDSYAGFCIADGYLYFNYGTPQWDDPEHPAYIYRMSLKNKKTEKIIRGSNFYIEKNKIYSSYISYDDLDWERCYMCSNLDGTDSKSMSYNYNLENNKIKHLTCNVSGYKVIYKTNKKTWNTKVYLKLKNGKKIFIANKPLYG